LGLNLNFVKMKKNFFSTMMLVLLLVSCKDKEPTTAPSHKMDNGSTMMENDATMVDTNSTMMKNDKMLANTMYACQMHPEVQGKLNDECSKCGMKLTEPVTEK